MNITRCVSARLLFARASNGVVLSKHDYSTIPIITPETIDLGVQGIKAVADVAKLVYNKGPEDPNKKQEHKQNILGLLKKPYVPPSNPKFGPVFCRGMWEQEFKAKINKDLYHLYFGPSELGKSMAIAHALKGRDGVVHLVLREDAHNVLNTLASVLGVPDCNDVMREFRDAVSEFLKSEKKKVVVLVEDIHSVQGPLPLTVREFLGKLVGLHNDGLVNVVFTVSDFSAVSLLHSVSGHSRLSASSFPAIDDETLVGELSALAVKATEEQKQAIKKAKMNHLESLKEIAQKAIAWSTTPEDKDVIKVFPTKDEAKEIVAKLDSHMGDTTKCLRAVVEDGKSVQDAVNEVIKQAEPTLIDALLGKSCGEVDRLTYIATIHLLYEALDGDAESVHWHTVVHKGAPGIAQAEVIKAVEQLVSNNLLSYIDNLHVSFHSRRLKWAYKNVCEDPAVKDSLSEARAGYKKSK
jgi:hypothetical protein